MRRKIILRLFLLITASFLLCSCVHDDFNTKEENHTSTFNIFQKISDGKVPDYAKGFATLYRKYHKINPEFPSTLSRKQDDEKAEVYLYLASQMFVLEDGGKAVIYPLVKNSQIVGLVAGVLNKEEDYVSYLLLSQETEGYTDIVSAFSTRLKLLTSKGTAKKPGGDCGDDVGGCGDIEPITIVPPKNLHGNTGGSGDQGPDPYSWDNPIEGGCGGFGDCGGGNNNTNYTSQDIINELKDYPCAQNLVQQLPNLKNNIGTVMKSIFQNNKNYNVIFRPKKGLGSVDGTTQSSYSAEFGTFKAIIYINDQVLSSATKEYILITMYHEVIHAFLDFEKNRLGLIAFQEQYPNVIVGYDYALNGTIINRYTFVEGHQQLGAYLNTLQNILASYNNALPAETVKAMAKAGITTMTPTEITLNMNEKNTSLGSFKGTKCP